jgi:hypothetical protein
VDHGLARALHEPEESLRGPRVRRFSSRSGRLAYHDRCRPGLAKILADTPGLAAKIDSIATAVSTDAQDEETVTARSMALVVARKFPKPKTATAVSTDVQDEEAVTARSMALLVAGKFPKPNSPGLSVIRFGQSMYFRHWEHGRPADMLLVPIPNESQWKVVMTANDGGTPLQSVCGANSSSTSKWCRRWLALCTNLKRACEDPECDAFYAAPNVSLIMTVAGRDWQRFSRIHQASLRRLTALRPPFRPRTRKTKRRSRPDRWRFSSLASFPSPTRLASRLYVSVKR